MVSMQVLNITSKKSKKKRILQAMEGKREMFQKLDFAGVGYRGMGSYGHKKLEVTSHISGSNEPHK